jgi:magnesium-protoporphyrin O-methyltransferase
LGDFEKQKGPSAPRKEKFIMECCQCKGIETKFDQKNVSKKLKKYLKDGPKKTTLLLIDALKTVDTQGMTILDIGGGLGDIQHALLKSGISHAINVDASPAYVEACKEEAERQGHANYIRHLQGNFVDLVEDIPPVDIVTLDRVICCYHDMPQLVSLSAQKATRFYGIVYPRDTWWLKLVILIYHNVRNWLKRNPMRIFVHSTEAVEALVRKNGLERCFYREMGPWQVVVYSRI